jgi:TolB-like protein/predicted Zn-dependent protease
MITVPLDSWSQSDQKAVRDELDRILKSGPFAQSQRRQRFLAYIVNETLAGRGQRLKGYAIAREVFDRPEEFDPNVDPIVRMEAARLRDRLREYYDTLGKADRVRIELPKGSYTPLIEVMRESGSGPRPEEVPGTPASVSPRKPALDGTIRRKSGERRSTLTARWTPLGMLAGAVLLIAVAGLWGITGWDYRKLPDKPSIAVLPFNNIGRDTRWERFGDGLTEDIIADLSRSRDLIVIARSSTEVYKDKPIDIRQVGRDLNVKYVLEGSLQPIGERIRVNAQLIEAASGSHVWSERYDRHADDLFAVQNEITQRIAATLIGYQGAVAEAERSLLRRKPPASLTAYETYLLGIEAKHRVTKESLAEAENLFRRAIELDPQFARAYCGLATVQYYLVDLGLAPSVEEAVRTMTEAAERAVEFDPNDGLAHQVLAMAYGYQGKPGNALAELNKAEALAPSDADLILIVAWSLPQFGETARAVSLAGRALTLNPHHPDWYNQGLSLVYFFGEQYDKSVHYRLLVKEPLVIDYVFLAMAYASLGRMADAEAAVASVMKLESSWNAERYLSEAGGYAEKEAELFVYGARKAGLPDCVTADKLNETPNLIRVKSCDEQRPKITGEL